MQGTIKKRIFYKYDDITRQDLAPLLFFPKLSFEYSHFLVVYKTEKGRIMQNDAGEFVDLYCPRKCSASNRLIHAKDHASVQLNIADVDPSTGRMSDTSKIYVVCGAIRRMGESDDCIARLAKKDGILAKNY